MLYLHRLALPAGYVKYNIAFSSPSSKQIRDAVQSRASARGIEIYTGDEKTDGPPGDTLLETALKRISVSQVVLCILSGTGNGSNAVPTAWLISEYAAAMALDKPTLLLVDERLSDKWWNPVQHRQVLKYNHADLNSDKFGNQILEALRVLENRLIERMMQGATFDGPTF